MRDYLRNCMEMKNIQFKDISDSVGCSKGVINKFFVKNENIDFEIVLNIVRHLTPDNELKLMGDYSKSLVKPDHIKVALEYCSTNRLLDELNLLVEISLSHKNKELNEWGKVFLNQYSYQTSKNEYKDDVYEDIRDVNTTVPFLTILSRIQESNIHFVNKEFKAVKRIIKRLGAKIDNLDEGYLKNSIKYRLNQMSAYVAIVVDRDTEKGIEISESMCNCGIGYSFEAYANFLVGKGYMTTSFDKSLLHLTESRRLYVKAAQINNVKQVDNEISLLNLIWNKVSKSSSDLSKAVNLYLDDQKEKASLLIESCSYTSESVKKMIIGLFKGEKEHVYSALHAFSADGNNLFVEISCTILHKLGEKKSVLEIILKSA
jgi:hypothetical protein